MITSVLQSKERSLLERFDLRAAIQVASFHVASDFFLRCNSEIYGEFKTLDTITNSIDM